MFVRDQGSDLELTIMQNVQDFDIEGFISAWVSACTAEEGRATTVKIEHPGFISTASPKRCITT